MIINVQLKIYIYKHVHPQDSKKNNYRPKFPFLIYKM